MFAQITTLEAFKLAVSHRDEIRFQEVGEHTVACYMVSMPDTFDTPEGKECRGIVFKGDKVVARPLHKFHNVGEKEATRVENIDWSKAVRVMDKRDGSMIHTVAVDVQQSPFSSYDVQEGMPLEGLMSWNSRAYSFTLKSKKSFMSEVAVGARDWISSQENFLDFCEDVTLKGFTAIFEYTAPTARIVLYYAEEALTLLHIRCNATGRYLTRQELEEWAGKFNVPLVDEDMALLEQLKADPYKLSQETTGVEGWVIQFENGDMVKLKTMWYMERHRAMTFLRERDVAKLVISEGLDDLKSLLVAEGANIEEIEQIERKVVGELNEIQQSIAAAVGAWAGKPIKDAALALQKQDHPFFSLVMAALRGKEPNIAEWYSMRRLDETFSLRQLNIMQSIGEPE